MGVHRPPHRPTEAEHRAAMAVGLPLDDAYAQAMLDMVGVAYEMKLFGNARAMLLALVQVRPEMPEVYMALAEVCQREGALEAAALCFEACLQHAPQSASALVNLGEIEQRVRKNPERAKVCFEQALVGAKGTLLTRAEIGLSSLF